MNFKKNIKFFIRINDKRLCSSIRFYLDLRISLSELLLVVAERSAFLNTLQK